MNEVVEKNTRVREIKEFLDENCIMYEKISYNTDKGYCVIFERNKYVLGKIFKKALYKIARLISMQKLRFQCMHENTTCPYLNPDVTCSLDFKKDCILEVELN